MKDFNRYLKNTKMLTSPVNKTGDTTGNHRYTLNRCGECHSEVIETQLRVGPLSGERMRKPDFRQYHVSVPLGPLQRRLL